VRLEALRIERLPGIDPGFALEGLDPAVNVVLGPNASGKTSLTRALEAVLYREAARGAALHVAARFEDAQGRLEATRLGRDIEWRRAGQPVSPPPVPDYHLRGCYVLRVQDLFAAGEPEEAIQAHIARAMAGGYALAPVADVFHLKSTHGKSELKQYQEAERALQRIQQAQRALRADEARLEDLRAEQERALAARSEAERCRRALALLEARRERRAREEALAQFPEGMARLHGDEGERLQELAARRRELEDARDAARRTLRDAEAALERSGLAGAALDETALTEMRGRRQALRDAERELAHLADAERKAGVRLGEAREALGAAAAEEDRPVSPDAVHRAEEALAEKRAREGRVRQLETELARLPEQDAVPGAEVLRGARSELLRWLAAPGPSRARARTAGLVLLALAALAGTAVAAVAVHAALALLLAPLALGVFLLLRPDAPGARQRQEARHRYRETGVAEPAAWDERGVRERLAALDREIAEAEVHQRRHVRRQEVQGELEAAGRALEETRAALRGLAERVGFSPERLDGDFHRWVQLVREHDEARRALGEVREGVLRYGSEASARRGEIAEFLGRHGEAPEAAEPDAAALEVRLRALEERLKARDEAERTRREARGRIEECDRSLARVEEKMQKLFARAGLEPGDETALHRRLELREAWAEARDALRDAQSAERERAAQVGDDEALLALVKADDGAALERRAARCEEQAARYEGLTEEIADINARLDAARRGRALEAARAARQAAEDALRERLEEAFFQEAGAFLLERVGREHETVSRPEVLERARERFGEFTRHHFELVFEDGRFGAVETRSGERRGLEELSSGTCTQLLLAVRLAFAEEAERGRESLPLFLDEALTTSDPERFRAAVESLWMLARDGGRQIFYLTAQPGDVAFWRREDGTEPEVIDLGAVRRRAAAVADPAALRAPPRPEIPAPGGRSPEAYGVLLGVPPVDPWADSGAVHLFHLLRDDLALLHRLLGHGVERAGQLRALLRSGGAGALLSAAEREALACRLQVAETWLELWRRGRGRPVERAALEASGAVSDRFIERVAALAGELGGDARALLAALEEGLVPHFRKNTIDALRERLEEGGHLDEREPLDETALHLEALAAVESSQANPCTPELVRAVTDGLGAGIGAGRGHA